MVAGTLVSTCLMVTFAPEIRMPCWPDTQLVERPVEFWASAVREDALRHGSPEEGPYRGGPRYFINQMLEVSCRTE